MPVTTNLNHDKSNESFSWNDIFDQLDWLPEGGLNIAHEAIDRHANGRNRDKIAMIWEGLDGERETYTFGQMKLESDSFANVLRSLGIGLGDRVFIYMERLPEIYMAFFGILKVGAIAGYIYSKDDADVVRNRMKETDAKVLVTQPHLRRKMSGVIPELFELQHIVIVNKDNRDPAPLDSQDLDYYEEMGKSPPIYDIVETSQFDSAIMHHTAGTTGKPKAALLSHQAVAQHFATGKWVLGLHQDDIYWCSSDPGRVTGPIYGMIAPWTNCVTILVYEGELSTGTCLSIIQKHRVTVWNTTSNEIESLIESKDESPNQYDLSSLRHIVNIGDFLSVEAVEWSQNEFGMPIRDAWWQAETGSVMCANYAGLSVKPGSMGKPIPGVEMAIVDDNFDLVKIGEIGHLAIRPGWPSMFSSYWNDIQSHRNRFGKNWYISGDLAWVDEDGYFWFEGRTT